jgi:hypothetical protein
MSNQYTLEQVATIRTKMLGVLRVGDYTLAQLLTNKSMYGSGHEVRCDIVHEIPMGWSAVIAIHSPTLGVILSEKTIVSEEAISKLGWEHFEYECLATAYRLFTMVVCYGIHAATMDKKRIDESRKADELSARTDTPIAKQP